MNLPSFLDFFRVRLATAENESNNVHSEEDEEDSHNDNGIQIQPVGSCFSYISLQICKGCTDVMQVA